MDILMDSSHLRARDRSPARGAGAAHCRGLDPVPVPAAEPGAAAAPPTKHLHPPLQPGLEPLFGAVVPPPGCGDAC